MADLGYVKSQLTSVPDVPTRKALDNVFTHILGNIRVGVPEHQTRAVNLQAYFLQSTSASDTAEFSIAHGLPDAPHWGIILLDLSQPGAKAAGYTVSRAADGRRVYLKADAGSTHAPLTLLVEA